MFSTKNMLSVKKTQIDEFESSMLDLIKYQQEQQLSLQKQQMENQRRIEEFEEMFLCTQQK